jgi:predicted acetyltransferase
MVLSLNDDNFAFGHLESDGDVAQELQLMRDVFGVDSGVDAIMKKFLYHNSAMTLKNHFAMKQRGKVVAVLTLIPIKWSIGGIPLKVAEMGTVATLPEYRHRGLIRRLVREYHREVSSQGYDLSVIQGIPYFYRQFGYEYALPLDEETTISLQQIPACELNHRIRPFTFDDIPDALHLFEQSQRKFYVRSVRDQQIWRMQEETRISGGDKFQGYVVEEDGKMLAYFRMGDRLQDKQLVLWECSDVERHAADSIVRFLKDFGVQHGLETLTARTSYYDDMTKYLVKIGAVSRIPPYAWQIRVTDYAEVFKKMRPLFEERLAASTYRNLSEKLNFNFRRYTVRMSVENGVITDTQRFETAERSPIGLNPLVFTQLLLGHRSREELEANYPDFIIQSTHKKLIDVLFPKLPSHIHMAY